MASRRPTRVLRRMPQERMPVPAKTGRRAESGHRALFALGHHRRSISLGQALVEFALILPVLMLIFLIALDFGRLFFSYVQVVNAAREAANNAAAEARYVQNGTLSSTDYYLGVANAANQETNVQSQQGATASLAVSSPSCYTPASAAMSCDAAPQNPETASGIGNSVKVTVAQPFTFLTPFIGNVFGGTLNLSVTATAPVMNPLRAQITSSPTPTPTASPTPTPSPTSSPSPTPSPTPTGTATPTPSPSPTPTPSPTPVPYCNVPDYYHTYWADPGSTQTWTAAGFTGTLTNNTSGHKIQSQTLAAGSSQLCTSSMTVNQ